MRLGLTLLFVFTFTLSHSQSFVYPAINVTSPNLADFAPASWTIIDSTYGDLNKDGLSDAAVVLQYNDSAWIPGKDEDSVFAQPRILLILFKKAGANFEIAQQSNSFILSHHSPFMDDPYQGILIKNGILQLDFHYFFTAGGWHTTTLVYKFRYQQGQFVLIGADYSAIHRATLVFEDYSYNFLIRKRTHTKGNAQTDKSKTTLKAITISPLKTLNTFRAPSTWNIEEDVFL